MSIRENRVIYRNLKKSDYPDLLRLLTEFITFSESETPNIPLITPLEVLKTMDNNNGKETCKLVAELDNGLIGFLFGYQKDEQIFELYNIFIADGYRSLGYGEGICLEFFDWVKRRGGGKVLVEYDTVNSQTRNFYVKHLGFNHSKYQSKFPKERTFLEKSLLI